MTKQQKKHTNPQPLSWRIQTHNLRHILNVYIMLNYENNFFCASEIKSCISNCCIAISKVSMIISMEIHKLIINVLQKPSTPYAAELIFLYVIIFVIKFNYSTSNVVKSRPRYENDILLVSKTVKNQFEMQCVYLT